MLILLQVLQPTIKLAPCTHEIRGEKTQAWLCKEEKDREAILNCFRVESYFNESQSCPVGLCLLCLLRSETKGNTVYHRVCTLPPPPPPPPGTVCQSTVCVGEFAKERESVCARACVCVRVCVCVFLFCFYVWLFLYLSSSLKYLRRVLDLVMKKVVAFWLWTEKESNKTMTYVWPNVLQTKHLPVGME